MKGWLRPWVACALLPLAAGTGQGISRIGNRSLKSKDGLARFEVPVQIPRIEAIDSTHVRLKALAMMAQVNLDVFELAVSYPESANWDREAFSAYFSRNGWSRIGVQDNCLEVWRVAEGRSATTVAAWGTSAGFVWATQNQLMSLQAVDAMLQSIKLRDGECRWR